METGSILIADTAPTFSEHLSCLISNDLPRIDLTVCISAQQTAQNLSRSTYSTIIADSGLIREESSVLLRQKRTRHALVPLILTADPGELEFARDALLHKGAFDFLAKPVDPPEALASIRMALWQAQFLQLLTQRERIVSQFEYCLVAYPDGRHRTGAMEWLSKRVDDTLSLVRKCMGEADLFRLDPLLIDLAGSVQEWTLERALDRLERMREDRVWA